MTEEERLAEHERLKQKYRYKGPKKLKQQSVEQYQYGHYGKEITYKGDIASSIAEFLPDPKRDRMEKTLREQKHPKTMLPSIKPTKEIEVEEIEEQ